MLKIRILLQLLFLPLLIGLFNVIVNPLDQWNIPRIHGFNEKITETQRDLLIKPFQITHDHYDTLILGSSVAAIAFSPHHPAFSDKKVYNFGLSGSGPHIQNLALNHALRNNDIHLVILSLDFFAFNAYWELNQPGDQLKRVLESQFFPADGFCFNCFFNEANDTLLNNLGWRGTNASLRTLIRQNRNPTYMDEQGFWPHYGYDDEHYNKEYNRTERLFITENLFPLAHRKFGFTDPDSGYNSFDDLDKTIELLQSRGIETKIIIPPMPARSLLSLKLLGLWPLYENWVKNIVGTNETVAQKTGHDPYPIWNMQNIHPSARDAQLEEQKLFFYEAFHPTPTTGDEILNRMYLNCDTATCWPGTLLTPTNVVTSLATLDQALLDYQNSNNPQINALLKNIDKTNGYRLDTN